MNKNNYITLCNCMWYVCLYYSAATQVTRQGVLCPLCKTVCAPNYPLAMKHVSRVHAHSSQFAITCGIER